MTQTRAQAAKGDGRADQEKSAPSKDSKHAKEDAQQPSVGEKNDQKESDAYEAQDTNPKKRKDSKIEEQATSPPPKKSARKDSPSTTDDTEVKPSPIQVLLHLLSPSALSLTIPESERDLPKETRIYATAPLSPFEELLSAVVLSRPISHKLGQRTIRTMLNPPYALQTPGAIKEAGRERVLQALWDARTQHKDKTADEASGLAEVVCELWAEDGDGEDGSLQACRDGAERNVEGEREWLKKEIKGLGETGLDIFCRRVQWVWDEVYPFVDKRTADALVQLGLPGEAEDLKELLEGNWAELDELQGLELEDDWDEEVRKRRVFVLVLERAVGASLEKNTRQVVDDSAR